MQKPPKPPKNIIYGARVVMEAMEAGREIDKILLRPGLNDGLRKDVYDAATKAGIPIQTVPVEKLDRLSRFGNHQGVLAMVAVITYQELEPTFMRIVDSGEKALVIALDQVSDVRNFGAIARTAECMGAQAIIIPTDGSARINADAVKVSAGALNHLPVIRVSHLQDMIYMAQAYNFKVIAVSEKADESIFDVDMTKHTILVMGSEEKGISKRILREADGLVKIPMKGKIGSLNVSVAAGMALSEAARQRALKK